MPANAPASFCVVLDANVLFPSYLRDCLLTAASAGLYQPYWTEKILEEVRKNVLARKQMDGVQIVHLLDQMNVAFPAAAITGYESLIAVMTNDEKDRHVAAAAVKIGAQVIVTNNLRDFPEEALGHLNLRALSSDDFFEVLLDMEPEVMLDVVEGVSARRKRPPLYRRRMSSFGWQGPRLDS